MEITKICEKMKERRKDLNMTQKELADAMHVSNQLISKWETGESVPALEYLQLLSEVLQTSVQYLMGMDDDEPKPQTEPAKAEPAEPKSQKPSFWRKNRKALIISIIGVAAAILITAITLLSCFVFAPAAGRKKYIQAIDDGIDEYLTLGYFNLRQTAEVDGEERTPRILQGYIDENGNAAYYNSVTGETVKDKMRTNVFEQSDYVQPASIKTAADLLEEQLKTWGDDGELFEEKELSYIRKKGSGYYLEFSDEFFFRDMKPAEKKNIKLTEKIKGEVVTHQKMTESISVTVRYRNTVSGEKFSIVSKIEFLQEKPQIRHASLVQTVGSGNVSKEQFLKAVKAVSLTDSMSLDLKRALSEDNLCYENGYAFYWYNSELTVIDSKTLSPIQTIQLSSNYSVLAATVYDGAAWCVRPKDSYASAELYRINLQTGTAQYKLLFGSTVCFFRNGYLCGAEWAASDYQIVYDLQTQKTIFKEKATVLHVDADGNIYFRYSWDTKIHVYGQSQTLSGKEFVKEEDGCVYFKDDTALYRYKNSVLQEQTALTSYSTVCEGDYCFEIGSNIVTKKNGEKVHTFGEIWLKFDSSKGFQNYYYAKILAVHNGMCLVAFTQNKYESYGMLCLFKIGNWKAPVSYTDEIPFDVISNMIRLIDLNGSIYAVVLDSPISKGVRGLYRLE